MLQLILGLAMIGQTRAVPTEAGPSVAGRADAVQQVQAGIAADQRGEHDTALRNFLDAIKLDPQMAAAYVDLSTVYMEQGQPGKAIEPLHKALQLDRNIGGAQGMLGEALLMQGYFARAIPHLQAAGFQGPLGIAQMETDDLDHAVINLQAALQKHPNNPDLLFYLSRAAGLLSKQAGDTLLAAHPNSARAHEALGENYWGMQRAAEAQKEYEKALQIQPDLPGAHLALGQIYADTQQWPQAEREFEAEVKSQPGSAQAAYELGNTLLKDGKIHRARIELKRADTLQPGMPETLYALGKAQLLDHDPAAAKTTWKRLLLIEPDSDLAAKAHFALASLYRNQGQTQQAAKEMQAFQRIKAAQKQGVPNQ